MRSAIEAHIRDADAFYRPLILHKNGSLIGGDRLLSHFDQSVSTFRKHGRRQASGVIERVNELAVARQLLLEHALASTRIEYEPDIVTGAKFDFVIRHPEKPTLYVEVKTVSPQSAIDEASWRKPKHVARRVVLDPFASSAEPPAQQRPTHAIDAALLRNAMEVETKLDAHFAVERGLGALIYCGDGLSWDAADVEVFATLHRATDVRFGVMIRQQDAIVPSAWTYPMSDPAQRFAHPISAQTAE